MNKDQISVADKSYMRHLVAQTNQYPCFYKYCDFEAGVKMLSAMNIQFTRADSLNDEDELNLSKCNITPYIQLLREAGIPEDEIMERFNETKSFFGGIGICSCGKSPHNRTLWHDYASKDGSCEDGICIELDQSAVINHFLAKGIKIMALIVNYFDNLNEILPWDLFLGNQLEQHIFLKLLYTSKLKSRWSDEDEVRFIYSEPFSGTYFRPMLSSKCITAVYYGKDMSKAQRLKIGQILNKYKHIKRIMSH